MILIVVVTDAVVAWLVGEKVTRGYWWAGGLRGRDGTWVTQKDKCSLVNRRINGRQINGTVM